MNPSSDLSLLEPALRDDPYGHWSALSAGQKAELALRVVLIGVESSGKTTLAQSLATHLKTNWVPEYGRDYTIDKYNSNNVTWTDYDFNVIAIKQSRMEREALHLANQVLICDTDALATCVWAERYLGHRVGYAEAVARRKAADLYILTMPDFPFVPDDIRDGEHIRDWMHGVFVERLAEVGVPTITVSGPNVNRMDVALRAIAALKTHNPRFSTEPFDPSA